MRHFFKHHLSDSSWQIKEDVWDPRFQTVHETLFTVGNGYLGSRGVLEEMPYDSYAGTYFAGVYDTSVAQVSELVNMPNPVDFKIVAEGEKVDTMAMDVLKHNRILDMKKGLLWRHTMFLNARKERIDYQSLRFFSMDDAHIGAMRIYFTPLDRSVDILVRNEVNTGVTNKGILTEGRKNHIRIARVKRHKDSNYLCVRTVESRVSVAYADYLNVSYENTNFTTPHRAFRLRVKKNRTACFTAVYSMFTSRDVVIRKLKWRTVRSLRKAVRTGFEGLLDAHAKAWDGKWRQADIKIKPDTDLQRALRFNIYHLIISGNERDKDSSVGARTLSGEGYRGHIFWDTEIFILPFFIYNFPATARNMLYYRYRRLEAARENARAQGYKGALFPWESARLGHDVTPDWHKNLDGEIIKIYTGQREHHISADIAYAVNQYFMATGDEEFMLKAGLEMLFETARFWASRAVYRKKTDSYHILHVIGPDEFHEDVDDNAYTNAMARFNILKAVSFYGDYKAKPSRIFRKLVRKIRLSDEEIRKWRKVADKIAIPFNKRRQLIEAFDGYFKKKDVPITELDANFMPLFPKGLPIRDVDKTRLVKQADVVMLLYLLSDDYTAEEKKRNFMYYEKRTLHKSSLSACVHSIVAGECGFEKAYRYFLHALYADLRNLYGNIGDGIHAASIGGAWQAVVNGFCGVRLTKYGLSINPELPPFIRHIGFKIKHKGFMFSAAVSGRKIELVATGKDKKRKQDLLIYNIPRELSCGKKYVFTRD